MVKGMTIRGRILLCLGLTVLLCSGCSHEAKDIGEGALLSLILVWPIFTIIDGCSPAKVVKVLSAIFLLSCLGLVVFLAAYLKSTSPEAVYRRWEAAHPQAAAASRELNERRTACRCEMCGEPSAWVLTPAPSPQATEGLISPPGATNRAAFHGCACDKHKRYLELLKGGERDPLNQYRTANYTGPGRPEVARASPDFLTGTKPRLEDKDYSRNNPGPLAGATMCVIMMILVIAWRCLLLSSEVSR